jgi:membrane fusion protein, multidrug efflux system
MGAGDLLLELDASAERAELRALQADLELAQLDYRARQDLRENPGCPSPSSTVPRPWCAAWRPVPSSNGCSSSARPSARPSAGELGIRLVTWGSTCRPATPWSACRRSTPSIWISRCRNATWAPSRSGRAVHAPVAAWPDTTFAGTITAISPELERANRTLHLQATLANPGRPLAPGHVLPADRGGE